MRRRLSCAIAFLFAFALQAQNYGNEWIDFSQQYFRIPLYKEGIYRIDSATLSHYYDLTTINPKNFQLFLKGKEQFLFINGEADGKINTGDYLEFYASNRSSVVDSMMYSNIQYLPNPYQYVINDTICAFLTLNNSTSNKRFTVESDVNLSAYPSGDHFYTELAFYQSTGYNAVTELAENSSDPHLTQAEGWGYSIIPGFIYTTASGNLNTYTNSSLPFYVTVNYSGASQSPHYSPDHQIRISYTDQNGASVLLHDSTFYGFAPVRKRFVLNSQNTNNSTSVTFSPVGVPSFTDYTLFNMHYIHFFYPHTTDLNAQSLFKLWVDDVPSSNKQSFSFSNFYTSGSSSIILLDLTNGKRIVTTVSGNQVDAVIPNGSGKKYCVLAADQGVIPIGQLVKVNQNGSFVDYRNIGVAKPYVIIYHKNYQSSAQTYKAYRQGLSGGNYQVIDADIEHLYEQFAYGVRKHPVAIRNFIKFLNDSLPVPPQYVLLIGKGIGYAAQMKGGDKKQDLLPTMGIPPADNLFTSALTATGTNGYYPEIPIGRLAVTSNSEVMSYLAKVQKHEEPLVLSDWKKQVLHFVGGDDEALLNELSTYMTSYEQVVRDTLFGAKVTTVKKTTTSPVQSNISDSLRSVINRGAALINFFGHGSTTGFDQAVDDPDMYNNKDKYPFVIANSCYSGDIHQPDLRSVSERFIIADQKGSVGFIATPSFGFSWNLNKYTYGFYTALSQTLYGKSVGEQMRETAYQNSNGDVLTKMACIEMTLSGDPAIKLNVGSLPDYQVFNYNVSFDLKKYTDSVGVQVNYKNLGVAHRDSFAIRIERYLPNGDSMTVIKTVRPLFYEDSMSYYFPIDFNRGIGLNKVNIKLDYYERISEVSEANNSTGLMDLFIPGGDILPVYPYKYAVVPKTQTITLKASTSDPFAPSTTYRLELDTCDTFTSLLSTTLITSKGGVIEWNVSLPYKDSTVYFWRVSRDSISPQKSFAWKESSFQTIGTQRGWGQAHFHQFKSDGYQYVNYQRNQRKFIFLNNKHSVQARSGIYPYLQMPSFNYYFDYQQKEGWPSGFDGWNIAVFDTITAVPKVVYSNNYPATGFGPYNNCVENGTRYVYTFGHWTACGGISSTWQTDLLNFLNSIPQNQYVLAYSLGANVYGDTNYCQFSTYSNALYNAFESIGATNIRTTPDSVPYIVFGRKGMSAGQGHTLIGTNKKSILFLEDSIQTKWNSGYVASEVIGPSYKWNSLHWHVNSLDNSVAGDTSLLKVIGIRKNGQLDTLASFRPDSADVMDLSTYADAGIYPFLKLIVFMKDNVNRTSPQLKRWQVLYDEAPECAINPLKGFASINDTLQEGDEVSFHFPIENIGVKNFADSLVITYWIENSTLIKTQLPHKLKVPPFAPGQILQDTVKLNTYQYKGDNALWIYVNPISDAHYQYEQSQFNNIGRYPFKVNSDITNPLLDVTFDGIRILNGDIVSAKPRIYITLKDENKFLALNDTGAFTIMLQAPNQQQAQRIYFGDQLAFTPGTLPHNSASILYQPNFTVDGRYTFIVQARDRSKNASAATDYRIQFDIDNHPSITQVMNYPNPFTTSTRFVFTLTGSEVPEVFTIQILTISGKVVREITRAELGEIHIGRNITQYAWDGRDNFGDRLANGVYLYRVITKLNGQNIDKNASGADKFFVKDFGKMVLMR